MRSGLDILYNFHWVVPGEAARAAQAVFGRLGPLLRAHKIKSVINLRGANPDYGWWHYERRICEANGVAHLDAMLDSRKLPTRDMLAKLFAAFDAAPKPFLVKCSGGQDRTGLAAALYLLHREGWGAGAKAMKQFARFPYLHFPKRQQRWLREFPRYAEAQAKGAAIAGWVRESYDPEAFSAWLAQSGMADSHKGIFDVPRASRWQW